MKPAPQQPLPELWPITVDRDLGFTHPLAKEAYAYWRSLACGRPMPLRRELKPRAMKAFLRYVNLVDVLPVSPGEWDYVVGLQSADAREILGDIKGRRFAEVFAPPHAQRWRSCFDLPRVHRTPVRLLTRASTRNKNWLACEVLLAPLGGPDAVQSIFWVTVSWPANNQNDPHLVEASSQMMASVVAER